MKMTLVVGCGNILRKPLDREREFLSRGGKAVFVLPEFEVVGHE